MFGITILLSLLLPCLSGSVIKSVIHTPDMLQPRLSVSLSTFFLVGGVFSNCNKRSNTTHEVDSELTKFTTVPEFFFLQYFVSFCL